MLKHNRATDLPTNISHYKAKFLLETIYYSLFNYCSYTPGQTKTDLFKKTWKLQKKQFV